MIDVPWNKDGENEHGQLRVAPLPEVRQAGWRGAVKALILALAMVAGCAKDRPVEVCGPDNECRECVWHTRHNFVECATPAPSKKEDR